MTPNGYLRPFTPMLAGKTSIDQEEHSLVPSRLMHTRPLSSMANPHRLGNLITSSSESNYLTAAENEAKLNYVNLQKSKIGKI
jgi:hypothetical protein